jgi:undecaprenyl diphosphate synthase
MDANGRWATRRQLTRLHGHQAGVEAIRRVVEAAPHQDVRTDALRVLERQLAPAKGGQSPA